jgi:flagellar hook protein FlgE
MRLESAIYSSREGITAHGNAISVIGDNISNVNTTGFKGARVEFSDLVSAGLGGPQNPGDGVGNGVVIQTVRQLHTNGAIEQTGRALDLGIAGNGFFVVGDTSKHYYSRAGNFSINEEGMLVDGNGVTVLGYSGSDTTTLTTLNMRNVDTAGSPTSAVSLKANLPSTATATTLPNPIDSWSTLNEASSFLASNLQVFDSLGAAHQMTVAFFKSENNKWTAQAFMDGSELEGGTANSPVSVSAAVSINFGSDGRIAEADQAAAVLQASPAFAGGAAAGNFSIDLADLSQFASPGSVTAITQDGTGVGNIENYEIRDNGQIYASLSTGTPKLIGTLPLATFNNTDGLIRGGNGLYSTSQESGEEIVATAGTKGHGTLESGSLERSTVDIADEFVKLVLIQRGYQANSQMMSQTSQMLRDTIGLLR